MERVFYGGSQLWDDVCPEYINTELKHISVWKKIQRWWPLSWKTLMCFSSRRRSRPSETLRAFEEIEFLQWTSSSRPSGSLTREPRVRLHTRPRAPKIVTALRRTHTWTIMTRYLYLLAWRSAFTSSSVMRCFSLRNQCFISLPHSLFMFSFFRDEDPSVQTQLGFFFFLKSTNVSMRYTSNYTWHM